MKFICVEGQDGTGKSTFCKQLMDSMETQDVHLFHEPGGTMIADEIANIFYKYRKELDPKSQMFLLNSCRSELFKYIYDFKFQDVVIILDRYIPSTLVYQSMSGLSANEIYEMCMKASDNVIPDVTYFLDIPEDDIIRNLNNRDGDYNIAEIRQLKSDYKIAMMFLSNKGWNIEIIDKENQIGKTM